MRSAKLVPLFSFWKAAKQYEAGDESAILLWDPGLCEEGAAWLVDALVIFVFALVLLTFIVLTCFIYSNGGSWTGTLEALQKQGSATNDQRLATMKKPMGTPRPSDSTAWLEQKQVNTEMPNNWQPRRLKLPDCDSDCLHSSTDDGECCCAAHCPSGVAVAYSQGTDERASGAITAGAAGTTLGAAAGAGGAAIAAGSAGTAAAGTAAAGTAAAGTAAAGTAAAAGAGATAGSVAGPIGAVVGGSLFLLGALLFAPGYEDAHCVTQCSYITTKNIWCYCHDAD